ncbi:MAG: RagB/SusD family nutrient uptake outer membrane protein [Gemmatimonadaceae bacterium]|nr:RagB/SusD family nutrient uptake outer membrane protein [Gemmatimonadaceae bacterium]NUO94963.1 RagB/SusD family nutrient uptake outer membrane protein [Gemmatimonadaceae bacterium]NUP54636.1 RagB/SusD family nutrient uptake outer membrane protein [Gemmatimonadaceae bacterium]NUP70195.1 RagB/SusD family nutrient uptake outer membrane protein [Gemmatimonadaceae bacterium]NUR32485.1 RagB/SusD family nutrient uptake outer membrane protein [Gemmatimonadaceae bacterium]
MRARAAGTRALIAIMLLATGTISCADLKEVPISGITDSYYTSAVGFENLVNATYSGLHRFYARQGGFAVTVFGTDEFTNGADGNYKYFNLYSSQLNGDAQYVRENWDFLYQSINSANAVIGRAAAAQIPDAVRTQRVAEAKFLRALYFFDLVRLYGDIPLPLEETTAPSTAAVREPKAKVYDAIIADLKAAEAVLPATQGQYGRATKGAAQHILALVYLTRAQAGDMALAVTEAKAVIADPQYGLLPTWKDLWDIRNEKNKEVVFAVQYTTDPLLADGGNSGHLYFTMAYELFPGMVRDIPNGRAFKRFRPTTWLLGLWDRTKDSRYDDGFQTVWIANKASTKPALKVGDTAIYMPGVQVASIDSAKHAYTTLSPKDYTDAAYPTLSKFLDGTRLALNDTAGGKDFYVARLAETYLIAAEASYRDGNAAEALRLVNVVRERAAKKGVAPATMDATLADLSLDFFLDERSRELAGEQMRWFDLVRPMPGYPNGKLKERLAAYNKAAVGFRDCHTVRPIPTTQMERTNPPIAQNPCY